MIARLWIVGFGAVLAVALPCAKGVEGGGKSAAVDLSQLPPALGKTGVTYARDIKPIFEQSCVKCHGAEKPKARLRLDGLETALKGSDHGKVVQPGNSVGSKLVLSVAHLGAEDRFMPPPKNKAKIPPLTRAQVGLIRAWIDQGAK
jgi:hypothetical protein